MSAVDDWSEVRDEAWDLAPRLARKADAAIAELEAELAALKEETLPVECGDCRYCVLRDDHIPGCDHPIGAEQAEAALAVLKARHSCCGDEYSEPVANVDSSEWVCDCACHFKQLQPLADRKAMEAELAALRPKRCRCKTCRYHVHLSHGGNAYQYPECPLYGEDFEADGLCHRWQARP